MSIFCHFAWRYFLRRPTDQHFFFLFLFFFATFFTRFRRRLPIGPQDQRSQRQLAIGVAPFASAQRAGGGGSRLLFGVGGVVFFDVGVGVEFFGRRRRRRRRRQPLARPARRLQRHAAGGTVRAGVGVARRLARLDVDPRVQSAAAGVAGVVSVVGGVGAGGGGGGRGGGGSCGQGRRRRAQQRVPKFHATAAAAAAGAASSVHKSAVASQSDPPQSAPRPPIAAAAAATAVTTTAAAAAAAAAVYVGRPADGRYQRHQSRSQQPASLGQTRLAK